MFLKQKRFERREYILIREIVLARSWLQSGCTDVKQFDNGWQQQRDTDYHETREGIVLARNWLQSKCSTVKLFDSAYKCGQHIKGQEGSKPQPDSHRSIANFLSKHGKAISHQTVKKTI